MTALADSPLYAPRAVRISISRVAAGVTAPAVVIRTARRQRRRQRQQRRQEFVLRASEAGMKTHPRKRGSRARASCYLGHAVHGCALLLLRHDARFIRVDRDNAVRATWQFWSTTMREH